MTRRNASGTVLLIGGLMGPPRSRCVWYNPYREGQVMLRFQFAAAVGLLVFVLQSGSSTRPAIAWDQCGDAGPCEVCIHGQARYGHDPYLDEELYFWGLRLAEQDHLDGFDRRQDEKEEVPSHDAALCAAMLLPALQKAKGK